LSWGIGIVEHMFDSQSVGVGLWPGERPEDFDREDHLAWSITCRELADGWVEPDRHLLPDGLEDLLPGPYLAAVVHSVDPSRLNGHDLVRLLQARSRLSSHQEAGKYAAIAETAFAFGSDPDARVLRSSEQVEYAALEVAAALTLTRRASEDQLGRAVVLASTLQRVQQAFVHGLIDVAKVRVFDRLLGHLPEGTVDQILDRILDLAGDLTTGQLRARLAKLVLEFDADGSKACFEQGLGERKTVVTANPDHTANFGIFSGDPVEVAAARANVERIARSLKTKHEPRTMDQLRADVALGLLSGRCDQHPDAGVGAGRANITVSAETLAGLSDEPGELDGYGPVFADIARKTVKENIDGEWTFTVTDQGRPVATGTITRRPTLSQQRQIRATYTTCVFPGCRQDAYDCDLDHRHPWAQGGTTCSGNLAPLCRHHHTARHHTRWTYRRLPNGDHQWTSPLGHTYIRKRAPPE
jgi:hypothetical protein